MDIIVQMLLFVATILGALVTSVLGWLDSGNAFDLKKFLPSLIRGIVAAVIVFIATYTGFADEVTFFTYLGAFIAGMAIDVVGNRVAGIVKSTTT